MNEGIKINTLHLFPQLDEMLITLLKSLSAEEWQAQTVAKLWKVKDVASHLLDGNLRALSMSRDGFFGEKPENIHSYEDLVGYLNQLNLDWTNATKRLSPEILIQLLESSGLAYYKHLQTLQPFEKAIFPVAWAGHETSPNWFHVAREYTEKFLHQQQIRDAVGKEGLMNKTFFHPFLETFMFALPHTFKDVIAETGTVVAVIVKSEIGGKWCIQKTATDWVLTDNEIRNNDAHVIMDPETAWKLFSKSWRPQDILDRVEILGDQHLGMKVLDMVSVMA
jgi:Mycothiol maleylpyruvate isomerase N-terminal domain